MSRQPHPLRRVQEQQRHKTQPGRAAAATADLTPGTAPWEPRLRPCCERPLPMGEYTAAPRSEWAALRQRPCCREAHIPGNTRLGLCPVAATPLLTLQGSSTHCCDRLPGYLPCFPRRRGWFPLGSDRRSVWRRRWRRRWGRGKGPGPASEEAGGGDATVPWSMPEPAGAERKPSQVSTDLPPI